MANDPLRVAQARIAELEGEISKLRQFVEMYEKLSEGVGRVELAPAPAVSLTKPRALELSYGSVGQTGEAQFSSTKEIISGSVEVLKRNGRAMSASQIYENLLAMGVNIAGKKPKANLTAKFSTRKDLLSYSEPSGTWSLVEWMVSPVKGGQP